MMTYKHGAFSASAWPERKSDASLKPRNTSRREQLLSGKVKETAAQKKARIKAENLAMRDLQRQKTQEKYRVFIDLLETLEFQEWYYFHAGRQWDSRKNADIESAVNELHGLAIWISLRGDEPDLYEEADRNTEPSKRMIRMQNATPAWGSKAAIRKIYAHRDDLNKRCPHLGPFHVDHVIPLAGRLVCGLHVEFNLRVIPQKENLEKSNKFIEKILRSCIMQFQYGE